MYLHLETTIGIHLIGKKKHSPSFGKINSIGIHQISNMKQRGYNPNFI
jgi:hypothetical protein